MSKKLSLVNTSASSLKKDRAYFNSKPNESGEVPPPFWTNLAGCAILESENLREGGWNYGNCGIFQQISH